MLSVAFWGRRGGGVKLAVVLRGVLMVLVLPNVHNADSCPAGDTG